jgi:hypothetical protein
VPLVAPPSEPLAAPLVALPELLVTPLDAPLPFVAPLVALLPEPLVAPLDAPLVVDPLEPLPARLPERLVPSMSEPLDDPSATAPVSALDSEASPVEVPDPESATVLPSAAVLSEVTPSLRPSRLERSEHPL